MRPVRSRRRYWVVAPPAGPSAAVLDHFGPHNLVEWVIWIFVLIVVLVVAWRVINRGWPPD